MAGFVAVVFIWIILFREEILTAIKNGFLALPGLFARYPVRCWGVVAAIVLTLAGVALWLKRRDEKLMEEIRLEKEEIKRIKDGKWSDARPYQDGLAPVKNRFGLWGFVDREGDVVYEPQFDRIEFYYRSRRDFWMCWCKDGRTRYGTCIGTDGNEISVLAVRDVLKNGYAYCEGVDDDDGLYVSDGHGGYDLVDDDDDDEEEEPEEEKASVDDVIFGILAYNELSNIGRQEDDGYYDDEDE